MTDLATFAASTGSQRQQCKTCLLPQDIRKEVDDALRSRRFTFVTISRYLSIEHHYRIGESSLRRHARDHLENTQ